MASGSVPVEHQNSGDLEVTGEGRFCQRAAVAQKAISRA